MSNFSIVFKTIFPLFVIMLVGFISKLEGLIKEKDIGTVNELSFKVFFPIMLFNSIYKSDVSTAIQIKPMLFVIAATFITFLLSIVISSFATDRRDEIGVLAQGMFRSNTAAVSIPIASAFYSGSEMSVVAVLVSVVIPLFNILSVICLEMYDGKQMGAKKIALNIIKNPLIIGCGFGLAGLAVNLKLPDVVDSALTSIGNMGSPLVLFLIGANIRMGTMKNNIRKILLVAVVRLVLFPALIAYSAFALKIRDASFVGILGIFASSTAVNSFTMVEQIGGDSTLAGDIVVITSAMCIFTSGIWCVIFKALGAF